MKVSICIAQNYRSFLPWLKLDISELDVINKSKAFSLWDLKGFLCLGKWKVMEKALEREENRGEGTSDGGGIHILRYSVSIGECCLLLASGSCVGG